MPTISADILLVTVTKVESRAVLDVFQEATKEKAKPTEIDGRTYFSLGSINAASVCMTQSEMGAGGLDSSLLTVGKGIEALDPAAVIMVGIAFGIDAAKQAIGDILVSENLRPYDLQKVGAAEIILRTDRPHSAPRLLNRMRTADLDWDGAQVRFGVVLTGEKLVDNVDFRDQLLTHEREAIGGEMEGAGLYVACQNKKVDWILVKAICDWADGNKSQDKTARQLTAATNAAKFVLHSLQFTPFQRPGAAPLQLTADTTGNSSLPTQPFFFGREKELAIIAEAIRPESRSWGVLIDGPGGIGKTALAVRAGHVAPAAIYPRKIFLSAKIRDLKPEGEQKLEDFMLPNYLVLLSELALQLGDKDLAKTPENERAGAVRRVLTGQRALIVIDNVETFPEPEQVRLYQFLNLLPPGCKAIVTSRRRSDVSAKIVRLERLEKKDALNLLAELAKTNRKLAAAQSDWQALYEVTGGNPLLLTWTAGQLGRHGSQCRTAADACEFLRNAPPGNDPLEYILGDLLDTFTDTETAVLAALTHFTQPAKVTWIVDIARLSEVQAETALEDLTDRSVLVSDPASQLFFLPPLAAKFLRDKRPEAVKQTGDSLVDRAYALTLENGNRKYERFPMLEAEWPLVEAALPRLPQEENNKLQKFCDAIDTFLDFSGRWDDRLWLDRLAEQKALTANDSQNAGWQAYRIGWIHNLRRQAAAVVECAGRAEEHWKKANAGAREQGYAIRLRGLGHRLEGNFPEAITAFRQALNLFLGLGAESRDVANLLNDLANAEHKSQSPDYAEAERAYGEALRIAKATKYAEGIAIFTGNLAELAIDRGHWPDAEPLAREALALAEPLGRQELIASNCRRLARFLAQQGRRAEGLPYAQRAVEIYTKLRSPYLPSAQATLKEFEAGLSD